MATASKTYGEHLLTKLMMTNTLKNKNVLFLHADNPEDDGKIDIYLNENYITNEKIRNDLNKYILKEENLKLSTDKLFFNNMEEILKFYNIDFFYFYAIFKNRASLNQPYFDKVYCYTDRRSIIPKQVIQMILRSRQIIDKKNIFYTPTCYYNKVNLNDYEEASRKLNIKKIELKQELEGNAKSLGIHLKQEEHNLNYDYLQNIINYDDYKKKCFYIYELINTLKKNLYNDPSFKYFYLHDSTEKREVKVRYNTKYSNWLNYNILNDEEYYKIK